MSIEQLHANLNDIIEGQREFQRQMGFPIDTEDEHDRNSLSERYIFGLIEEAIELRKEFPSTLNPWSKSEKQPDLQRIKEEFADILMFAINIAIVWKLTAADVIETLHAVQVNNFRKLEQKKQAKLHNENVQYHTT